MTARMMKIDGSNRIIKAEEMVKNFQDIPTDLDSDHKKINEKDDIDEKI